jgi:RHS repeat-associated protein
MSRRTSKKVYSWDGSAWQLAKTEKFAWDGWNLVAILNASDVLQNSFCWGEDGLIADTDHVNSKAYLPIYDGNKNIHGYVDAADGSLVSEYDFDPFGRIVQQSGTGDFPFRFASYFRDAETGMIYYGYRYYSPEMGRWVNRDMIAEVGGLNLYGTSNDFVNMFDILGMWTEPDRKGGNWAIICSDKNDDTIHSLANKIHLEEKQALGGAGWLRDKDGKELPAGTIIGRKAYSIPNVVTVYTSRPQFGSLWRLKGINPFTEDAWLMIVTTLRQKAVARGMDYENKGFNVKYMIDESSNHSFISQWEEDGLYGVIFAGHGAFAKKTSGSGLGYLGFFANPDDIPISPNMVNPRYKLAIVLALSCGSADSAKSMTFHNEITYAGGVDYGMWYQHVSANNGKFIGFTGPVNWWNWWQTIVIKSIRTKCKQE